ncbi:hypothetical protein FCOIX_2001 [Fusarium coicis]|nr:hypothetical protein FCOIX_2001 [Fusarium coicis]
MPLKLPENRSPYANIVRGLNDYHDGEEPPYILMTIIDRNGPVLCETKDFDLLLAIIYRDDVTTLEQDLDIAPWAIEGNEELPRYCSFFYTAVSHGSLDYTSCTAIAVASDLYSTRYIEASNWQSSVDRSEAVVNLLLNWGARSNDVVAGAHQDSSWKPETVLSMASEWAGAEIIDRLITSGADVHARFTKDSLQLRLYDELDYTVDNVTATHTAAFRGNFVVVKTLLAHHGDAMSTMQMKEPAIVNMEDIEGNTAPYFGGNGEVFIPVFETLCDKGADASIRNNQGETPLYNMLASADGTINKQIISLLLAHGAKINDINNAGNSPLQIAARRLDDHDVIAFLVKQGADTTIGNSNNDTPVHIATCGHVFVPGMAEKVEVQDEVLKTLTKVGGVGLMDLANAEEKTPREICEAQREKWREDENRERMLVKRRQRNLAIATSCSSSKMQHHFLLLLVRVISFVSGELWPYDRYHGHHDAGFLTNPSRHPSPECFGEPANYFLQWLGDLVNKNDNYELQNLFEDGIISDNVTSIEDLSGQIAMPQQPVIGPQIPAHSPRDDSMFEASLLFRNLNYELEPDCLRDKSTWWFRTYEGHCNWLKKGESGEGSVGSARPRDYQQYMYADGISEPRDGPNPRAVSNAFFKRKKKIYYDHTPLLLGLIEFIMHDVTYSQDSVDEFIEVPMPEDEQIFPLNTTLRVPRTASMPGTGTSRDNPRENINMATTWLDISSLYGSSTNVADRLRSKIDGKLLTQELQSPGTKAKASYLPFNTMGVPTNTRPGVDPEKLFAGGDPRTNEDWLLLGIHTLLLREHNRLCDILRKQKPAWDDEQLYQTVRLVMSAKHALISNAYQMAYWTEEMPWPRDDGFPLYRQMFGENALEINPANTYPWPLVTRDGKPMTVSAEMAVVYRFHEFIIPSFPIKDQNNETLWEQNLFDTSFNSTGFLDVGLERILAGALSSHIPNFKSGVDESFRSAGLYRGRPLDIVVSSIVHEREQGLPTFNQYFRAYNAQDPEVVVPARDTWEKFSTDPEVVQNLKKLYKHPDDVDLVVGCQLDEEFLPGTTVPKSALVISLFSLFGMGNSDRFSIGFAMMRCLLVDRPWDCHPSNALEDLIWERKGVPGFPNFRFYSDFWVKELDLPAHGTNLLWRLITENSEINCVQRSPLFPSDTDTNPILCSREASTASSLPVLFSLFQIALSLLKRGPFSFIATVIITVGSGILAIMHYMGRKTLISKNR